MKNNLWCGRIVHRKTHCTQILRIMRLTVFFLLFIVFETYSLNVRSQNQKVTISPEQIRPTFIELIVLDSAKVLIPSYCKQLMMGGFDEALKSLREQAKLVYAL